MECFFGAGSFSETSCADIEGKSEDRDRCSLVASLLSLPLELSCVVLRGVASLGVVGGVELVDHSRKRKLPSFLLISFKLKTMKERRS